MDAEYLNRACAAFEQAAAAEVPFSECIEAALAAAKRSTIDYDRFVADYWRGRRHNGADAPDQPDDELRQLYIMSAGLAGETGEVLEHLKKHVRDGVLDRGELALELGDALYYLVRIATWHGFTLAEIQERNIAKLEHRRKHGKASKGPGPEVPNAQVQPRCHSCS